MSQYTFENIDDFAFESLCRDLLNEHYRIDVRTSHELNNYIISFSSFKRGRDGGIDLLYEKDDVKLIGQIKHIRGDFKALMKSLKQKRNGINEADKANALSPTRYYFMTSVPLSLTDKQKLVEFFSPHIKDIEDIYGRENLNDLLTRFEHVHRRHVHLYFNSTFVLDRLFSQGTLSGSEFTLKGLQEKLKSFVQTANFSNALEAIDSRNLLIIKGLPGVGKTTLAELLCLYYAEKGYRFVEIFIIDDIIERLLDDQEKCIFYYNDFLGANALLIKDALRNEGKLSRLLRRISSSSTKKIVLTTRNNLFINAEVHSENLERIFSRISPYELDISTLTFEEKEQIVRVHAKRNNLSETLFADRLITEIASHRNFSPRLIESITDHADDLKGEKSYYEFVMHSLSNPQAIWRNVYHQTSQQNKIYLNHLYLFGNSSWQSIFRSSFENRIRYEANYNNYSVTSNEFRDCTRLMDTTFITIRQADLSEWDDQQIEFINPSFADFLIAEIRENPLFVFGSIMSVDRYEILYTRINHKNKELARLLDKNQLEELFLKSKRIYFLFKEQHSSIAFFEMINSYFAQDAIIEVYALELQNLFDLNEIGDSIYDYHTFLSNYHYSGIIRKYVIDNYSTILTELWRKVSYVSDFENILDLIRLYAMNINKYLDNKDQNQLVVNSFKKVIEDDIADYLFRKQDYIRTFSDVEEIYNEKRQDYIKYLEIVAVGEEIVVETLDRIDWQNILLYRKFKDDGIREGEG